jgi:SAM-dependent methyltransferase
MDGENLALADESFDIVYAHGVLPYVESPEAIASEIHRVLRPGGTAVLMVYHTDSWLHWASRVTQVDLEHVGAPVFRTFRRSEVEKLLEKYESVRIVPERYPVATRQHRGRKAALYKRVYVPAFNALPRRLTAAWGWHLMIWARK